MTAKGQMKIKNTVILDNVRGKEQQIAEATGNFIKYSLVLY